MQLLAPLFLLGLALAAIPFWLHKLKTETPERKTFASNMFLKASEDPVHVRSKLRYLLLMAMRILFLALLALVFTQPFWPRESAVLPTELSNLHLIVVDSSASMASDGKLSTARNIVDNILDELGTDEAAQLFSVDQLMREHGGVDTNTENIINAFDEIEVSVLPLNYDYVARAVEPLMSIDENAGYHYQIHFISDFQQSSMPSRFADLVPEPSSAASYDMFAYNVSEPESAINIEIDQVDVVGQEVRISVRSFTHGGLTTSDDISSFELRARVGQSDWRAVEGSVEPSNRTTLSIDGFEFEPTQNRVEIELIVDDELQVDNAFYFIEDRSTPEPLLLLTDNPYGTSALYISALFADQVSATTGRNYVAKTEVIADFDARTLDRYSWVLIDDIGSIGQALGEDVADFIRSGGAVFAASGANAETLEVLPISSLPLAPELNEQGVILESDSQSNSFTAVASVDQGHPALNGLIGWSDLRFQNWLTLTELEDVDVLVQLENGSPLLIEQQIGRGKLMLMASSLDNQWNNLPVKPLFVAMMRNTAQYLSGAELIEPQAFAGDTLNIQGDSTSAGQLIDPDGGAVLALGDSLQSGRLKMDKTGFYQAYTSSGEYWIGVNLHPNESELVQVPAQSLVEWQQLASRTADASAASAPIVRSPDNDSDDYYMKMWFWLLVIAAAAVLIESLLANRYLSSNTRVIQTGPTR